MNAFNELARGVYHQEGKIKAIGLAISDEVAFNISLSCRVNIIDMVPVDHATRVGRRLYYSPVLQT